MRYTYTADFIYHKNGFLQNHVIEVAENGIVTDIRPLQIGEKTIYCEGILCPGFINAHCHLELSALHGSIPEHTGMTAFGGAVMQQRKNISAEENAKAIKNALQEMWQSGTQAVGDICNDNSTAAAKKFFTSMFFYNFIEVFGMRKDMAAQIYEKACQMLSFFEGKNQISSLTLHAPYSLSKDLLQKMAAYFSKEKEKVASIHLLESKAERAIFEENKGEFSDFYTKIGIDFQGFPTKSPIDYVLSPFEKNKKLLLVHNTEMKIEEIESILNHFPHTYFCLCPRSNLFIHNTFPNILLFASYSSRICLGTDSLASNHSLEMLAEIYAIQQRFPQISLHTLIKWLTTNGAEALQQENNLGNFIIGKNTGLIHIQGIKSLKLTETTKATRLL